MHSPSISVVMPSLNQARYIAGSVQSVMSQDVGYPFELVVADGGSTDGTLDELAALSVAFPGRIHWISTPDGGPAQAVNAAVGRAQGAVVGWLNSDDIYHTGAVRRAVTHFAREPEHVMVYGEAEHVDECAAHIARYPTRPPQVPLSDYADGCHICQPTAFFRREVFLALGGLDTTLRTAFDFDFWLRLLKAYPSRVGFIPELQACSRLHPGAITMRMREHVALEGAQVIHRHLGGAPVHWLLTHYNELKAQHPFQPEPLDLVGRMRQLAFKAEPWLVPGGVSELLASVAQDRALQTSSPNFIAGIDADGWARSVLDLRLRQSDVPVAAIRLRCRHASPLHGRLRLKIASPDADVWEMEVTRPGHFEIEVPVTERGPDTRLIYRIATEGGFIPAEVEPGSTDDRRLAFLVDEIELLSPPAGARR
jgi:hypothetical protein